MDMKASEGDKRACVINADHLPTGHVQVVHQKVGALPARTPVCRNSYIIA